MRNGWRRRLLTLGLVMTTLAACAPGSGGGGKDDAGGGPVTLAVWGWRQEDTAAYAKIFKVFEKENPGITVKYVPYKATEYDTILRTGLSGQSGPDVAQLRSYGLLQPLIQANSLVALDGDVPALKDFPASVLDGARGKADEKVYGVPFAIQTLHVIYDKAVFVKHNLAAPTTWGELTALCKKLQSANVIPFASTVKDTWMLPIQQEIFGSSRYGGEDFRKKLVSGQATFTDPNWVASVDTWASTRQFWPPKYTGIGYDDARALFSSGKAAMFPGGIWEVAGFQQANPGAQLGIFAVPPPPGAVVNTPLTPGYVDGSYGVSARSAHRSAALKLVTWMAGREFGQTFSDELKQISAVPGVQPKDPLLAEALAAYQAHPSSYISYAYFGDGTPTGWDLAQKALSDVLLGRKTSAQAATEMQKGIDTWFKPGS
jgi:raffinose/stachyose/melibiose transport system substrate-binding protein